MSLPNELIENPGDLNMRLGKSIIEFNGDPVIHLNHLTQRRNLAFIDKDLRVFRMECTEPALSVHNLGAKCGLFDTVDKRVALLSRLPVRQFCQGLNPANCYAYSIQPTSSHLRYELLTRHGHAMGLKFDEANNPYDRLTPAGRDAAREYDVPALLLYCLTSPGFFAMWHNRYKDSKKPTKGLRCLSRGFYTDTDSKAVYAANIQPSIGEFEGGRVRFLPKYQYLSQSLERQTGIMPL